MRIADFEELRGKLSKYKRLVAASIEITLRCNENCIHCLRNLINDDGLKYDVVCSVLDQLADMGCIKVTFTGGEPFARRDFMDIVRYAWSKRFAITILTNGTLITPAIAAELKRLHVAELHFSLYAADPDIHDTITTVQGSYDRTLRGIHFVKKQGLNIRIATSVMSLNADQVPAVEEVCEELGAVFTRGTLIFPRNNGEKEPLTVLATDEQVLRLAVQYSNQESFCVVSKKTPAVSEPLCSAGRDHIGIGPDGAIYPCDALRLPIGNIRTDRIADAWYNSTPLLDLRAARREYPPECWGCSAREWCLWCPGLSLQLMGDPYVPNPQDCRRTRIDSAQPEADAPGWWVPAFLQNVHPSGTDSTTGCVPASLNGNRDGFVPPSDLI